MRSSIRFHSGTLLFAALSGLPLVACAASEPPPAVAPPTPAPVMTAAAPAAPPPAAPPAPAPAPAPAASPAPESTQTHLNHRHPLVALFLVSLDALTLTADQKAPIEGIKADLAKHAEVAKEPREKLRADVVASVISGKFDQAKIDADIGAMSAAVAATAPALQDDMNRLHQTLTAEQRKKLIEAMREKGKQMHEHGMAMHEHGMAMHEHGMAMHEHGMAMHEHGDKDEHGHAGKADGREHEPPGKEGDDHGMWEGPLAKLGDELSLTADQSAKIRTKVEALVKAQHAAMKDKMAAAEKHMAAVGTAFEADKFDAKKAGVGAQASELVKSVASDRVQFVQAVLPLLTPEQRPKFAAHIQAHDAEMD